MSAELAARRTSAAAVLADFKHAADEFIDDETLSVPRPDYSMWAFRLASELGSLLHRLDDENSCAGQDAARQLERIRLVLSDAQQVADNRQYALEQIEGIVNGDGR